jgi:NAD(P)-dependent dehydrogenase (short-subunit alcohol dehydrogenase family)
MLTRDEAVRRGRVLLLTGGTRGIGAAALRLLVERDWYVVFTGRDEATGDELAAELAEGCQFLPADLSAPGAARRLVDETLKATGRLDAVVNNAGIHALGTTTATDDATWDALLALNLRVPFQIARAAIPALAATGGGVVVNVASEAGLAAVPGQVAYNVSKAGLVMLTRSIAADHAADGVRAVSICPGTTATPLVRAAIAAAPDPAKHEHRLASSRPANRLGRPEEIAEAIAFAVDPAVRFMTGSELVIDGGFTAV